jgi:hypothetical protein
MLLTGSGLYCPYMHTVCKGFACSRLCENLFASCILIVNALCFFAVAISLASVPGLRSHMLGMCLHLLVCNLPVCCLLSVSAMYFSAASLQELLNSCASPCWARTCSCLCATSVSFAP